MTGGDKGEVHLGTGNMNQASDGPAVPGQPAARQAPHPSLRAALLPLFFYIGLPHKISFERELLKRKKKRF